MDNPRPTFGVPQKTITTEQQLAQFQASDCKRNLLGFILSLQDGVQGKGRSRTQCTANCTYIIAITDAISKWVDQTPPLESPQRYGNKAFTTLQQRIVDSGRELIRTLLLTKPFGQELVDSHADLEINTYLSQSFGDPIRIDYGTGHELNFISFLLVLFCLGYLEDTDRAAMIHHIFWSYITLMRKIQTTYRLEPAGSHGVWGLDDYHFLPFLFGASELIGHDNYTPNSIHDDFAVQREANEYLYFHCIDFIKKVKSSGHFGEHSPMLNDISGVPNWGKVSTGLIKMYQAEVLNKLPVMKHFLFGTVIAFTPS
ncbi:unnamed protein product [Blepharisma stoltei]|uniref:Serine/threonine-protein phosphatase 2A activator n=1 Tax=Blepharisma stoltei TaxID=1481888 RepID=A0AAU9KCX1_9CILI|nr:unnamed protein product [Blepharisma stoltei]